MKKFLSLVLALVMAMSLVTISAGAKDFTDDADVNYDAAVEVMSELKVIDGYTDGSFRPATELNRGAAAKIICNMILGPTTAAALSASSAPFSDVPADSVFAGYITYCSKEGIIDGYADGTFRPTAPLTGYAFAKMLLGALGYDPAIEGYVGANWSINVAKQALGIGLDDGIDGFVGTQYVNRETACQMAMNALQATMVEYDSKTTVTVNGAEVVVGGARSWEVGQGAYDDTMDAPYLQFAEKYFPKLTVTSVLPEDADFGRPGKEWKIKNKSVGVFADDADATYTVAVKGKEVYADLGASVEDVVVYEDGEVADYSEVVIAKKGEGTSEKYGHQGALTEVYFDADANDGDGAATIVIINTYLMQVTEDYDDEDEILSLESVDDSECPIASAEVSSDDVDGLEEFVEDDYVLVTISDGEIMSVVAAESTSAVVDEHVLNESLTADGAEYKFAYAWEETAKAFNYAVDEEYVLYFDTYGNIIYSEGVEAEKQYVYVDEFAETSFMDKNSKVDAYVYFLDGSEDEVRVTKVNGKKVKAGNIETAIVEDGDEVVPALETVEGQWFTYTEKDGAYELKTLRLEAEEDEDGEELAVELLIGATEGTIISDETVMIAVGETVARGNKGTQFVIVEADGDVTTYTGIKKAPEVVGDDATYVAIVVDENNYADYVFIALGEDATVDGTADSSDLIFVMKGEKWGTDAADVDYYRYKAIVNGEEGKVRAEDGTEMAEHFTLYTEIEYDSESGYVSDWTAVDSIEDEEDEFVIVDDATELTQKGNVIAAKGEDSSYKFYMADEAVIYVIDMSDEDVETVSAKTLCKNFEGGKIYGIMDKNDDVVALYVVVA